MKRRIISFILSLLMVVSILPVSAFADDDAAIPEQEGTAAITETSAEDAPIDIAEEQNAQITEEEDSPVVSDAAEPENEEESSLLNGDAAEDIAQASDETEAEVAEPEADETEAEAAEPEADAAEAEAAEPKADEAEAEAVEPEADEAEEAAPAEEPEEPIEYTVIFYADGEVFSYTHVLEGKPIGSGFPQTVPEKEGFRFTGWFYINPTLPPEEQVETVTAEYIVVRDMNVKAGFQEIAAEPAEEPVEEEPVVIDEPAPSEEPIENTKEPSTEKATIEEPVVISEPTAEDGEEPAPQVTLHFNLNGGDSTNLSDVTQDANTTYRLNVVSTNASRAGYQFLGWDHNASATDPEYWYYYEGMTTGTNQYYTIELGEEDVTLYAIWGYNWTLTYDANANGATVSGYPKTVTGTYVRGNTSKPSRTGYTFLGWSYNADGTADDLTTDFTKSQYYRIDQDTTVYAIWSAIEYTIQFDLNGGEGTLPESIVFTVENKPEITLPGADGYTKEGRTFAGWSYGTKRSDLSYSASLNSADYAPGATIPVSKIQNANKTIYAVWKYIGVTENVDLNGGTKGPSGFPKTVNYGTSWSLPLMTVNYYKDITLPDGSKSEAKRS